MLALPVVCKPFNSLPYLSISTAALIYNAQIPPATCNREAYKQKAKMQLYVYLLFIFKTIAF